jgi:hypothetical protein
MTEPADRESNTPSARRASSKRKHTLSLARMRRNQSELTLLSLYGSLDDALRAHLLLYQNPAATQDVNSVLLALRQDSKLPLSREEAERIRRLHTLQTRVASGETVTITQESLMSYHHFVAELLSRYGITVVDPETVLPLTTPPMGDTPDGLKEAAIGGGTPLAMLKHYHPHLMPLLLVVLLLVIAATTTILVQQSRGVTGALAPPTATSHTQTETPSSASPTQALSQSPTPTPPPPNVLTPGRTAYVRPGIVGGLALRSEPGTAADIPIQIYLTPGTAVQVVEGPTEADGYRWWLVRAANHEGWCAGEYLEVR